MKKTIDAVEFPIKKSLINDAPPRKCPVATNLVPAIPEDGTTLEIVRGFAYEKFDWDVRRAPELAVKAIGPATAVGENPSRNTT